MSPVQEINLDTLKTLNTLRRLRLSKSPSPRHGKFNQVGDQGLAPCHVVDGDGEGHSPLGSTHGVWRFVPPSRPGTGFELKTGDD